MFFDLNLRLGIRVGTVVKVRSKIRLCQLVTNLQSCLQGKIHNNKCQPAFVFLPVSVCGGGQESRWRRRRRGARLSHGPGRPCAAAAVCGT